MPGVEACHALAFGESAVVLQFNRHPCLLVALARRWLAIPCVHFFDDIRIIEPLYGGDSARNFFDKLCKKLGYAFDPKKDTAFEEIGIFLDGVDDLSLQHEDQVTTKPTLEKLEKLRRAIFDVLEANSCKLKLLIP